MVDSRKGTKMSDRIDDLGQQLEAVEEKVDRFVRVGGRAIQSGRRGAR
jgi:hypothetical protein